MASPYFPTTAPASGIFPAPAYATYHQPFPFFATPPAFPSPIPAQSDPIWPPVVSPPIHGNLHNSSFPFFYPYLPPAAAYMPMSGLSPNWPPPSPDPNPSTDPPTFSLFPASMFGAPTTTGAPANTAMPATEPLRGHDRIPCSPLPANLSSLMSRLFDAIPTAPNQERRPSHGHNHTSPMSSVPSSTPCANPSYSKAACMSGTNKPPRATSPPTPTSIPCDDDSVFPNASEFKASLKPQKALTANFSTTYASCDPLSCEFHKMHARLDKLQTRSRVSIETIQGKISGLSEADPLSVSSVGLPENLRSSAHPEHDTISGLGASTKHPTTTASLDIKELFPANTNCLSSVPPPPACNVCPIAEVSTLAYSSAAMAGNIKHPQGQPIHFGNLQVPTTMQDASSVFGEMPEQYGFHNLCRQTVIRADGTENSYYTLPENYPLELASPEPVFDVYDNDMDGCSTKFLDVLIGTPERAVTEPLFVVYVDETDGCSSECVDVFTTTFELQPYEDEQQESEQPPKCISRPSENPLADVVSEFILQDNVDISVARYIKFRHGQRIRQVLEYVFTSGCAIGDVQLLKNYKLNMLLTEEGRELWDPGAKTFFVMFLTAADTTKLQYNSLYVCIWDPGIGISSSMSHRLQSWTAATENPLPSSTTSEPTTWLSQVNITSYAWDPGTTLLLYMSIWLLVFRAEKAMVTPILEQCSFWFIAYYGVALWLIHFLPP